MKIISTLIILLCVSLTYSDIVIDMAGKFTNYTCFKNYGYSQIIIRAYHSYGAIDLDAKQNIHQANAAGLATDLYMFPCRGKDPAIQVKQLIDYLSTMKPQTNQSYFSYQTGTIWLDIQTNPSSGCSWTLGTPQTNCQFIKTLIDQLQKYGRSVGIYASHYMWLQILGGVDKCNIFTTYPIWYAHYDYKLNFDDWETNKFGGWAAPTMKQFTGDAPVCGFKVDLSYY